MNWFAGMWKERSIMRRSVLVAVMVLVGSCSLELPGSGAPPRMYILTPKSTFAEDLKKVEWQLLVEIPQSPAGVNTARIALQDSPIEMRYFQRANWTDFAPKMVQTLLVESFENSGSIVAVGRQAIGLRSDYILKTDLREFQAEYAERLPENVEDGLGNVSPPNIHVRINAKLIKMPRRSIVASENFEFTIAVKENSMQAIVGGFDDALGKAMRRLVEWTLKSGSEHYVKSDKATPRR